MKYQMSLEHPSGLNMLRSEVKDFDNEEIMRSWIENHWAYKVEGCDYHLMVEVLEAIKVKNRMRPGKYNKYFLLNYKTKKLNEVSKEDYRAYTKQYRIDNGFEKTGE